MGDNQADTGRGAGDKVNKLVGDLAGGMRGELRQGPSVFNKSLYSGMGKDTRQGMRNIWNAAGNKDFRRGISGAMDYTSGLAGGGGIGTGPERGFDQTVAPGAAAGYDILRQQAIDDAQMAANRSFASGGTFGGGSHRQSVGQGVGQAVAGMDYQRYRDDIGLQERDIARQEGAFQSDLNQRQMDFAQQERAQANLPGLFNASLMPGQTRLQVGQMRDADKQGRLLGKQDLFRRQNDAQMNQYLQASGLLSGTGSVRDTTETPWWQTALGYGTQLAGTAIGAKFNPFAGFGGNA